MSIENDNSCPNPSVNPNGKGWLGKLPTIDEREILAYLLTRTSPPNSILHVGVGNSLFYQALGDRVKQGLTLDGLEADFSRSMGLPTVLANKYAIDSYANELTTPFDCIIDANIRSYSCCDAHFKVYMEFLATCLKPGGCILTSMQGLSYLKPISLTELGLQCPKYSIKRMRNVVSMLPHPVWLEYLKRRLRFCSPTD
jgi:hypothetical protein